MVCDTLDGSTDMENSSLFRGHHQTSKHRQSEREILAICSELFCFSCTFCAISHEVCLVPIGQKKAMLLTMLLFPFDVGHGAPSLAELPPRAQHVVNGRM